MSTTSFKADNTIFENHVDITGTLDVTGNTTTTGTVTMNGDVTVTSNITMTGEVLMTDDVEITGKLSVDNLVFGSNTTIPNSEALNTIKSDTDKNLYLHAPTSGNYVRIEDIYFQGQTISGINSLTIANRIFKTFIFAQNMAR